MLGRLFEHIDTVYGYHRSRPDRHPPLGELLRSARRLRCTDPRDKVYGVLELHKGPESHDSPMLRPDYTKSCRNVYRDATRYALRDPKGWPIVWRSVSWQSDEDLEKEDLLSWVPARDRAWDECTDPSRLSDAFTADGNLDQDWQSLQSRSCADEDVLEIEGFIIDEIKETCEELRLDVADDLEKLGPWLQDAQALLCLTSNSSVMAYALMAGWDPITNQPISNPNPYDLETFLKYTIEDEKWPLIIHYMHEDRYTNDDRVAGGFMDAFREACINRRIFGTRFGYMGVGPKVTRKGDVVVIIIYGSGSPYVLRPRTEGRYRILGECYVHGIMNGEATRAHKAEGLPRDQFFSLI